MTDYIKVSALKFEAGDEIWVAREEVTALAQIAYYFTVDEYDGEWVRVRIDGHADAPEDGE